MYFHCRRRSLGLAFVHIFTVFHLCNSAPPQYIKPFFQNVQSLDKCDLWAAQIGSLPKSLQLDAESMLLRRTMVLDYIRFCVKGELTIKELSDAKTVEKVTPMKGSNTEVSFFVSNAVPDNDENVNFNKPTTPQWNPPPPVDYHRQYQQPLTKLGTQPKRQLSSTDFSIEGNAVSFFRENSDDDFQAAFEEKLPFNDDVDDPENLNFLKRYEEDPALFINNNNNNNMI